MSAEVSTCRRQEARTRLASAWHAQLATLDRASARGRAATLPQQKLLTKSAAARDDRFAMSLLPPGRS